jgi:sugar lactone lactonase YvrE
VQVDRRRLRVPVGRVMLWSLVVRRDRELVHDTELCMTNGAAMKVLMEGIRFGESMRYHDGRIWFSDWAAGQVIALDPDGTHQVVLSVASFPMCFDFLPDGRLLVVDSERRQMLRREADGSVVTHADLASISDKPFNDIVVDSSGRAYVNNINFDFPGGEPQPGFVALVTPNGDARVVAGDLAFPNGMAITDNGRSLIVAESYGNRLTAFEIGDDGALGDRRVWAVTPNDHPDGICVDAEGAIWYADVGGKRCVRVREGGEILNTVELDRGAFDCTLGRGENPRLYVVGQEYGGPLSTEPTGIIVEFPAPAPGAAR